MYSLVSAPVLGFDLVRRPGGEHVAALVRAALAMGPDDLPILAAARRADVPAGPAHDAAWLAVAELEASRRPVSALIGEVYAAAAAATPDPDDPGALRSPVLGQRMAALEAAPLGTLCALLRCVRHDVLDWTWRTADGVALQGPEQARATAVLCDAVTAAYWYGVLDSAARRHLAASWTRAQRGIGTSPDAFRHPGGLGRLLERLGRLDGPDLERLRVVSHRSHRMGGWAQAVHEASWATHLTDRVRMSASVQMCAVEQLVSSGVSAADSASGVWNTVSGALAAQVVADVLNDEVVDQLLLPVRLALGLTD